MLEDICVFPFPFAPSGWAMCNGQLLLVAQSTALFSVIGITYGGDGVHNFALPDLEGNVPLCVSSLRNVTSPPLGGGLSTYALGQFGGEQTHTLIDGESPSHSHNLNADGDVGVSATPAGFVFRGGKSRQHSRRRSALQQSGARRDDEPAGTRHHRWRPAAQQYDALSDAEFLHRSAGYFAAAFLIAGKLPNRRQAWRPQQI